MSNVTIGARRRQTRRQRVTDTLVRHGLTEGAARALYGLGLRLRRRMLKAPAPAQWMEHAGMIDGQTGQRIGTIAIGTINGVDVNSQLEAARGHHAASVHTHPGSSSLSPDDAALLVEEAVLDVDAVIGADGTWYVLSIEPGATLPARARIEQVYTDTVHALAPLYDGLFALGLTDSEVWQEHSHGVWQKIAPSLGLRYDRIG